MIRGGVFLLIITPPALLLVNRAGALFAAVCGLSILIRQFVRRMRLVFFQPSTTSDVDTGRKTQHWQLRPRWRNLFKVPGEDRGIITKANQYDEIPPEAERLILENLNRTENKGQTPITRVRAIR